jgi:HEAT repeat protein
MNPYATIETLLASADPASVRDGLALARHETRGGDTRRLAQIVTTLFYIDPLDRPDLVPALDEAIDILAGLGRDVIPPLLEILDAGDMKAQMMVGQTLGRMGAAAIAPLVAEYESSRDDTRRALILYALGKIRSQEIVVAAPLALDAALSGNAELRDTAARAIGKLAETVPPGVFPEELRRKLIECLRRDVAAPNPTLRSKAVRSLGKLAKNGHLTVAELKHLIPLCEQLLGEDEAHEWDHAYIVRKEATEALESCEERLAAEGSSSR